MSGITNSISIADSIRGINAYKRASPGSRAGVNSSVTHLKSILQKNIAHSKDDGATSSAHSINSTASINAAPVITKLHKGGNEAAVPTFAEMLRRIAYKKLNKVKQAEAEIDKVQSSDANIIEVMASVTEAENALQELTSVCNKVTNGYLELMRMAL
ncbi:MAG: flagellar hook-basal body complex protein FliE [Proteobacteria bacterium]|nr:flagellar hook-basal body complex protein FliE [Pseudomonadota bacterium]